MCFHIVRHELRGSVSNSAVGSGHMDFAIASRDFDLPEIAELTFMLTHAESDRVLRK